MSRFLVVVVLAACGPPSMEIRTAETATYNARPQELFDLAVEVAKSKWYDVEVDREHLVFSATAKDHHALTTPGAPYFWALAVAVVTTGDHVAVKVIPKSWELRAYAPPRYFSPADPNFPRFVTDRADALSLAIYERANPYIAGAGH